MAGLNLVEIQDLIAAHIRQEFDNYEVYEDYVLDDQELQKIDSRVKPYIVISWDGLSRSSVGGSFSGVRYDQYFSGFSIGVIAPTPRQCRRALNIVADRLIGWSPDGVARLTPGTGMGTFVVSEKAGKPHLYMSIIDMSFPVNYDDPGSYIQPSGGS
jgi:hypothetical protein